MPWLWARTARGVIRADASDPSRRLWRGAQEDQRSPGQLDAPLRARVAAPVGGVELRGPRAVAGQREGQRIPPRVDEQQAVRAADGERPRLGVAPVVALHRL